MVSRPRPDAPEKKTRRMFSRLDRSETTTPLRSTSVTNGRTRFIGNESILVQGSGKVEGWWIVTGTQRVTGRLEGSGTLDWTGPWYLRGAGAITGNTTLDGDLTLGTGRFIAGSVVIDKAGAYGGRVASTGASLLLDANTSVIIQAPFLSTREINATDVTAFSLDVLGHIEGNSLDISGAKNFRMPHPLKPRVWLRHGSTESPVSGTEYTGRALLGADGSVEVSLPDYFEGLNKPENRTVQVTPIGLPFLTGAGEVEDGKFTVYGDAGREVFWLVKAERFGGDFLLEEAMPDESEPAS